MLYRFSHIFAVVAISLAAGVLVTAQPPGPAAADNRTSVLAGPGEDKDRPKSFRETLVKLRIQQEKKEFNQMIARGEEALQISTELENAFAQNGRLTERELVKVAAVEKLVKKIRSELGGDDDSDKDERPKSREIPVSRGEAVKSLRSTAVELIEELKKTTRFSISAAAIETSNAVIRLARFLRIAK